MTLDFSSHPAAARSRMRCCNRACFAAAAADDDDALLGVACFAAADDDNDDVAFLCVGLGGCRYRAEKDPARGMFTRIYGPEWTEEYIHGFLFDLEVRGRVRGGGRGREGRKEGGRGDADCR